MRQKPGWLAALPAASLALAGQASATTDAELAELRQRIELLESSASSNLNFGLSSDTQVTIYGYVKADFIYDADADLGTTFFGLGSLTNAPANDDNFRAQAIQSRLAFRSVTQTDIGEVQTQIEGDFFGGGGGQFRLRHANISVGNFLIGRTWTNFMPISYYPGTLDFQGPAGIPFSRQTQARYTHPLGENASLAVSIENGAGTTSDPVFTAALDYGMDGYGVRLAALGGTVDFAGQSFDRWGVNLSGGADLWQGGAINASYTIGEGIASYMVYGGADARTIGGITDLVESEGATVGLTHDFNDHWGLGLAYGYREDDRFAAADTQSLETVHASLFWHPTERMTVGLEAIYGERTLGDDTTADASRFQSSVQFNF